MAQDLADTGVQVVGVAPANEDVATVGNFVDQTGVTFPIVWDDQSLRGQIEWPAGISPYPRQVVLDGEGRIVYVATEHRDAALRSAIRRAAGAP